MRRTARLFFGALVLGFGAYIILALAWGVAHSEKNELGSRYGSLTDVVAGIAFLIAAVLILSPKTRR